MPYIFVDYLRICKVKYPTDINWKCLFCTDHLCETLITGELACGNLKNRQSLLKLWNSLTTLTQASDKEVLYFIEHHQLMGRGTGYVDTHLLASVALATNVRLWTCDKRLAGVASRLDVNRG